MEPEGRGGVRLYLGWKNSAWNRKGGEELGFILDGRILHGTGGVGRGIGFIYPSHRSRTDFLFLC
jgi:hypothetical protein